MKKVFAVGLLVCSVAGMALFASSLGMDFIATQKIVKNDCTVTRSVGIFNGNDASEGCLSDSNEFKVLSSGDMAFNKNLQYTYLACVIVALFPELIALSVALYNVFSRPYQTYADTSAFIGYFSTTLVVGLIGFIMLVVLWVSEYPNSLPDNSTGSISIHKGNGYTIESTNPELTVWLTLGAVIVNMLGIVVAGLAKQDAAKIKANEDFIEGPKGNDNDIFSL